MHRLFVALRPPSAVRATLLAGMGGVSDARWQDDAQLHLTLRFIGAVDGAVAEDIAVALDSVRHPPITVVLSGFGAFERRRRVDTLWIGASPRTALAALHRKIDQALIRIGLSPEGRAYLPHITLARLGVNAGDAAVWLGRPAMTTAPFMADAFHLYESHVGHEGATYETIARYPLKH